MKREGKLKEKFLLFENLYKAFKKAYKATKEHEFAFNVEKELFLLQQEFSTGKYIPSDYRYFTITDPKEREIAVASFRDRVVHHALINILEPIYEKLFIYDSYATRKNKGVHKAIEKAQCCIKKNRWYLKMDIKKYFASINHNVLTKIIEKKIKDIFIIDLCKSIIAKGGNGATGLPIGNLTSQFFANVYLNSFDYYVKEKLKAKYYLRYMDDFCIFSDDKEKLKLYKNNIEEYLKTILCLEIKESATMLNKAIHGLPFLGVLIFPNIIHYRKENFRRSFKKLKKREWEYNCGLIDYKYYASSMQSILAHITKYGNALLKNVLYK